jgi:hypothetical protein
MIPEQQAQLNLHIRAIANILDQQSDVNQLQNLATIEETIREQTLKYITPQIGFFFIQNITNTQSGRTRNIRSIIGELPITEKQAIRLNLKTNQRISPYLEKCCLRASANISDENAAQDVEFYTGMKISGRTQQRIVHRYQFPEIATTQQIEEISLDGGKVRLRTEQKGESCVWRDYKAICVNQQERKAWFAQNEELIDWVNQQKQVKKKKAENFCNYLETHRERIVNYGYYQEEQICSIGSGAVESTVKQIDRRLKISGAQWNKENIPQVLKHRCAYLNNCL